MIITKKQFLTELQKFSFSEGSPVIVHTSLKAIGEIEGGAETLLSALLEFVLSKGGILCVPSHTWTTMRLDLRKAESCIGVFPKIAAAHPEGVRSLHPTHSMVVFGEEKRVKDFVLNESKVDTPVNPSGCYGNLYRENGYVLLIGVDHTKNTFLHCVEEMMNVPGRLTDNKVEAIIIHKNGNEEKRLLHWFDESAIPDVSENFGKLEAAFRYHRCIQDGVLGNANMQLCEAVKMKNVMELIYENSGRKELFSDKSPLDESLYKF